MLHNFRTKLEDSWYSVFEEHQIEMKIEQEDLCVSRVVMSPAQWGEVVFQTEFKMFKIIQ